ncbi:hypothetical protein [Jannaschia sp. R86511]|uniref:hypothetical protein n=1 Tax=Jannaschia sp. R86511 TaxID=3093853 RepID=UPI0036D32F3A
MELGSVRELKQSWSARVTTREVAAGQVPAAGPVALGAAPRGSGYALAVRYRHEGPLVARLVEQLRAEVGDGEVDVRRIGPVRALTSPAPEQLQGRLRPLVPGCSVCHEADTAGTLGALVERDGEPFLLSNSHVLARAGLASPGDVVRQPGPADGGTAEDRVGVLETAAALDPAAGNRVDAALARPDAGIEVDVTGAPTATARLDGDELVEKLGRTTGLTRGRVTAIEVDDVVVDYGAGVGLLRFDGQIEVGGAAGGPDGTAGPFSRGGDSGSLVRLADGGSAVGLLFAGSEAGGDDGLGLTYCNVIDDVLTELGAILAG